MEEGREVSRGRRHGEGWGKWRGGMGKGWGGGG